MTPTSNVMTPRAARYAAWMHGVKHPSEPAPVFRTFAPDDHAAPVLASEPTLTDENRADLHDLFHMVPSTSELAGHLRDLNLPASFKGRLLDEKNRSIASAQPAAPQGADKVLAVVKHLAEMDPQVRETAETHPRLLAAFIAAGEESK